MASWKATEPFVVPQGITEVSSTAKMPLGAIVRARHETYGAGEFIYLAGVASCVQGSWVTYNAGAGGFTTTLIAANAIGPVAVAMAAIDSTTEYGFFQISGEAWAVASDVADSGRVYIDTASGRCDDALVNGDRVKFAKWTSVEDTEATTRAFVMLNRPVVDDKNES